ncbi:MAG: LytR C-terminal domain-containing protein [Candidatus Levybacteria bacterium]|nr:LytR C-terminal domain-containing protein [Candidatus Levybacteria bacterium]
MAEEASESFLNPSRRSYTYENSKNSGNNKRVILIILGIIILVGLVAYAAIATGGKGEEEIVVTPSPTTLVETPTPTPQTPSPTAKTTPTTTPKASPTPGKGTPTPAGSSTVDKTTGLDRANLKIAVLNGSGVAGAATKVSDALKKLGYDVVSSGNADNFDYTDTTIQVKSTKKTYLDLLKKDLSEDYTIGTATSNYTGTDADAVVIIGK